MAIKTTTIQLRVTEHEKKLIRHAAKLNGLPVSAFLRLAVLNANLRAVAAEQEDINRKKKGRK